MVNEGIKVSIITVTYNGVKTIEQTIQSVLRQTYKNIEYILIDGLSTDGTQQIIEQYIDNIDYFVSEKDEGLYYAMNKGLKRATGDIIGIINCDDWLVEDAVASVVDYFERHDVDLTYGNIVCVTEQGEEKLLIPDSLDKIWYRMVVPHPSVFIKKEIYERFGCFNTKYKLSSDYELMLRLYNKGIHFGYINEKITYFRMGGLSTIRYSEACREGYAISMSYIDKCPNKRKILPLVKKVYRYNCFSTQICAGKGKLSELINRFFQVRVYEILIWGTGVWGERCYNILKSDGITILHFVDNNPSKWGTEFQGIRILNPEELLNVDAYVLIAVKENGETIKKQLDNMENKGLKCVCMGELEILFCHDE